MFFPVGIFHPHLRVGLSQLPRGLNIGEKSLDNHLSRLTMQREAAPGCLSQLVSSWPPHMLPPCDLMQFDTNIPYLCCFPLGIAQALHLSL